MRTLEAAIFIASPVAGLRPSLAARKRDSNVPNLPTERGMISHRDGGVPSLANSGML